MSAVTAIKEEEIRPDDLFSKFMDLSANDAKNFFDQEKFVDVACPACGSATTTSNGFEKFGFCYAHCDRCGSIYASPRPSPEELLRYYAESASQRFWSEKILKQTEKKRKQSIILPALERVDNIIKNIVGKTPQRILDVGAANGTFLSEWKSRHLEAQLIAIEPGAKATQKCRDQGMSVFEGFVEDEAEKGEAQGDLVTYFKVLEVSY